MYKPKRYVVFLYFVLCFYLFNIRALWAAAYQIFPPMAYENAAMLNEINQHTMVIGSTDFVIRLKYTGSVGSEIGTAVSDTDTFLPYLRLASRINSKWVASFDVSHPLLSNVQYPADSFVDVVGIDAILIDTNYSPKVSYQITDKFALGAGFDVNNISNAQVNLGTPPPNETINKSQGFGYGWDVGLTVQLSESNLLAMSYYSQIDFKHLRGTSTRGSLYRGDFSDDVIAPATFTLNLVHHVTSEWTLAETARFVWWSAEKGLLLKNSVDGDVFLPLNYEDIWSFMWAVRYQCSEHLALGGVAEYVANAQSVYYRPIVLPTASLLVGGALLEYHFSSEVNGVLRYAFAYANPKIDQPGPPLQQGRVNVGVNVIDLGFTWKM